MQDKIQELTDKLYREGLSKGQEEGERLISQAKEEAAEIIAKAKAEAAAIAAKAEKDAADIKAKAEGDIRIAGNQAIQSIKTDIQHLIVTKAGSDKVTECLEDSTFVKEIIRTVAERFSAQEATDIELILPEKLKSELEPFVNGELSKALKHEVKAEFSKKIAGGFNIAPKDGGYFISFSDETLKSLIAAYLRPVTGKILFG